VPQAGPGHRPDAIGCALDGAAQHQQVRAGRMVEQNPGGQPLSYLHRNAEQRRGAEYASHVCPQAPFGRPVILGLVRRPGVRGVRRNPFGRILPRPHDVQGGITQSSFADGPAQCGERADRSIHPYHDALQRQFLVQHGSPFTPHQKAVFTRSLAASYCRRYKYPKRATLTHLGWVDLNITRGMPLAGPNGPASHIPAQPTRVFTAAVSSVSAALPSAKNMLVFGSTYSSLSMPA
jgi:hypothetical protein